MSAAKSPLTYRQMLVNGSGLKAGLAIFFILLMHTYQSGLLRSHDLGNLVAKPGQAHTAFTYHRTWETGLGSEIRVTDFSPDFFVPRQVFDKPTLRPTN